MRGEGGWLDEDAPCFDVWATTHKHSPSYLIFTTQLQSSSRGKAKGGRKTERRRCAAKCRCVCRTTSSCFCPPPFAGTSSGMNERWFLCDCGCLRAGIMTLSSLKARAVVYSVAHTDTLIHPRKHSCTCEHGHRSVLFSEPLARRASQKRVPFLSPLNGNDETVFVDAISQPPSSPASPVFVSLRLLPFPTAPPYIDYAHVRDVSRSLSCPFTLLSCHVFFLVLRSLARALSLFPSSTLHTCLYPSPAPLRPSREQT